MATRKIADMLDTFDTRLGLLESAIRPLHRETTTLIRCDWLCGAAAKGIATANTLEYFSHPRPTFLRGYVHN